MKQTVLRYIAPALLLWAGSALADPITVTYDIGSYSSGGYSGSFLHEATGCEADSEYGGTLYMCGESWELTGSLTGSLDEDGVLSGIQGVLNIGDYSFDVLFGVLGQFDGSNPWALFIDGLGIFVFENLDMGEGMPNFFDGNELILWGQNLRAYCDPGICKNGRWGLDLYGRAASVPEPGTLALLGLGLLAMGLGRRRQLAART